nr:natural killer cell receptor 2B4-like [Danio rerio]|eukprot:XP_005163627.1 natural killer cell receptor 2B4-like [Danio rerio]
MTFQLLLSFVLLINTGFSSDISVFVQTGDSVQLDIQAQLPEFEAVYWTNKKSDSIVRYLTESKKVTCHTSYKDRVDFNNETFSLTLKNMQKADSGLYTAKIFGETNKDIVKYNIYVIDEVEAPVLTVNSNCSSSELCSFTCSGQNTNISSIYNSSSCPEEEVTSADDHTLRLNCNATFIMCNYSNPLSWKTDIKKVHELISKVYPDKRKSEESHVLTIWLIVIFLVISLGLFVVIGSCVYKRRKGAEMNVQTVYEDVDENKKPQKSPEMLEQTEKPVTVYHTIGEKPDLPIRTNTTHNNNTVDQTPSITENSKSAGPATIYCTIEKQPDQPKPETDNTIYAMVKKPLPGFESPKLH